MRRAPPSSRRAAGERAQSPLDAKHALPVSSLWPRARRLADLVAVPWLPNRA